MTIKYPRSKAGAQLYHQFSVLSLVTGIIGLLSLPQSLSAADKLIGIHSARVLSQSMPWVATEAGLFKKYNLDFDLVFDIDAAGIRVAPLKICISESCTLLGFGPRRATVTKR